MDMPKRRLCYSVGRVALDIASYLTVFTVVMLLTFNKLQFAKPFERGFYCDDQDLMYPSKVDTVSNSAIASITVLIVPAVMLIVESGHIAYKERRCLCSQHCVIMLISTLYKRIGIFLFASALNMVIVECLKSSTGRLRPNFFAVCKPNWTDLNCSNEFITDINCGNTDTDAVTDARKAFPSGHAAASSFAAFYLVIYLHVRIHQDTPWVRTLCPLVQTVAVAAAIFISVSRLQDYRHHPADVIAGAVIGVMMSLITVIFYSDLPKLYLKGKTKTDCKRRTSEEENKTYDNKAFEFENDMENGLEHSTGYLSNNITLANEEKQISNKSCNVKLTTQANEKGDYTSEQKLDDIDYDTSNHQVEGSQSTEETNQTFDKNIHTEIINVVSNEKL